MWRKHPECLYVIESSWAINVVGFLMYILNKKLLILKSKLKLGNKETFENVQDNVKEVEVHLQIIHASIESTGHNDILADQEK